MNQENKGESKNFGMCNVPGLRQRNIVNLNILYVAEHSIWIWVTEVC